MQKKKIEEFTMDELNAQKKTLKTINYIMMVLVFFYVCFFGYLLIKGTWQSTNTMGVVMLAMLGVIISLNSSKIGGIKKELEKRAENK
jgi:hypothetical protein